VTFGTNYQGPPWMTGLPRPARGSFFLRFCGSLLP